MKSLGSRNVFARSNCRGSCWRTQSSLGALKPTSAGFEVSSMSRAAPTREVIASHCSWLRPSHQMSDRPSGSPAPSSRTTPCIWPERPIAITSRVPAAASASCTAPVTPRHQSFASCSAHSGFGVCSGYSRVAPATTRPSAGSTRIARAPVVPTSMPSRSFVDVSLMGASLPALGQSRSRTNEP